MTPDDAKADALKGVLVFVAFAIVIVTMPSWLPLLRDAVVGAVQTVACGAPR